MSCAIIFPARNAQSAYYCAEDVHTVHSCDVYLLINDSYVVATLRLSAQLILLSLCLIFWNGCAEYCAGKDLHNRQTTGQWHKLVEMNVQSTNNMGTINKRQGSDMFVDYVCWWLFTCWVKFFQQTNICHCTVHLLSEPLSTYDSLLSEHLSTYAYVNKHLPLYRSALLGSEICLCLLTHVLFCRI